MKFIEMLGMLLRHGWVRLSAGEAGGVGEARDSAPPTEASLHVTGQSVAEPEDTVRRNALFRAGPWQQK